MLSSTRGPLARELLPLPGRRNCWCRFGIARAWRYRYNERRAECVEAASQLGVAMLRDVDDVATLASLPAGCCAHVRARGDRERARAAGAGPASTRALGALMDASHASCATTTRYLVPALDQLVALLQAQPAVHGARLTGAGSAGPACAVRGGTRQSLPRRCSRLMPMPGTMAAAGATRGGRTAT